MSEYENTELNELSENLIEQIKKQIEETTQLNELLKGMDFNSNEIEPQIYDALSSDEIVSILADNVLSGISAGIVTGSEIGIKTGLSISGISIPIGTIAGGLAGLLNGMYKVAQDDDNAFGSYVQDQYEEIYSNRMTEISTGSAMADNAAQFALTNPDIIKNQLAAESGSIYNDIVGEANGRQNQVLLSDGVESLYDAQAMFEGRKEAERTDYNTDVMGYITGGRDELLKDYSDDMLKVIENTKIKYEEAMKVISAGEEASGEDVFNQAIANLTEVNGVMESLGNNAYLESDLGQLEDDMANSLVDGIQAASANTFDEAGYNLGMNLAEGIERAVNTYKYNFYNPTLSEVDVNLIRINLRKSGFSGEEIDEYMYDNYAVKEKQNAYGIQYVPYNGYRAVLHEGERVLKINRHNLVKTHNRKSLQSVI